MNDEAPRNPPPQGEPQEPKGILDDAQAVFRAAQRRTDGMIDEAEARVFRFLWLFLPAPSVARQVPFQHLLVSRLLSDMAQQALLFGVLVEVTRNGASAFQVTLVGVAALLPPATLGLYGGIAADALTKRVALAGIYSLQAALCFVMPLTFGTDLSDVLILLFAVNALGQISGPAESSALPLVATEKELASAASLISLASAVGTALGIALLAPIIVRAFGVDIMLYVSGALLLAAASRVFDMPVAGERTKAKYELPVATVRSAMRWLVQHPAVLTMIVVGVLSGTGNIAMQTLAPRYVQSVLDVDAADAAYVFALSSVGLGLALLAAPSLIRLRGERIAALGGLLFTGLALFLLGMVGRVSTVVDPVNPLRLLDALGLELEETLRTAALMAVPLAFGVSLTATAIQTYINRRVPLRFQGRTFSMQSWLKNGAAIFPLLALGALASAFGIESVLLVMPLVLLLLGYGLVYLSIRIAGLAPPSRLEVFESFWEEPENGRSLLTGEAVRPATSD